MMKINGKESPVSLYKFYLPDKLIPTIEVLKATLGLKTNSDLFSAAILHVAREIKEFQDWQAHKEKEEEVIPESKL